MSAKEKVDNELYSINDSTSTQKNKKNILELELMGKGIFYTLNYNRKLASLKTFDLLLGTGFSIIKNNQSIIKFTLPLNGSFTKQLKSFEMILGGGINLFFCPNGTQQHRNVFWIESEYNYLYKRIGESIGNGYYYPKFGLEKYMFLGLNYNFKNNTYLGICYYYAWFFNHYFSDDFLKSHFLGIKIGLKI